MPTDPDAGRTAEPMPPLRRSDWARAVAVGLLALAVLELAVLLVRPGYLSFTDAVPYILQSHVFADGRLTRPAPPPELEPFFKSVNMLQLHGREFSRQPPGGPALFAPFLLVLGDIRLVPPVLSAVAVALVFVWTRITYHRRLAVLACVLCLCSVTFHRIGASILPYVPSGLLLAAALLVFTVGLRRPALTSPLLCGALIGLQFTVRPYSAVLSALGLAFIRLALFRKEPHLRRQALAFAAGVVPGIALLLLHNAIVTGDAWPLAFSLYDPNDRLGFGTRGLADTIVDHTPARALGLLLPRAQDLLRRFYFPDYLFVVSLAPWLLAHVKKSRLPEEHRLNRWDLALLVLIAAYVLGHALYWYPRTLNYYEVYPLLAVLSARSFFFMWRTGRLLRILAGLLFSLAVGGAAFSLFGLRAEYLEHVAPVQRALRAERRRAGPLLVFLKPARRQLGFELAVQLMLNPGGGNVISGLFNTSRDPNNPVIYARDRGPDNARLVDRYPHHSPRRLEAIPTGDRTSPCKIVLTPLTDIAPQPPPPPVN